MFSLFFPSGSAATCSPSAWSRPTGPTRPTSTVRWQAGAVWALRWVCRSYLCGGGGGGGEVVVVMVVVVVVVVVVGGGGEKNPI